MWDVCAGSGVCRCYKGASLRGRLPPPATLAPKEELNKMRMTWTEMATILQYMQTDDLKMSRAPWSTKTTRCWNVQKIVTPVYCSGIDRFTMVCGKFIGNHCRPTIVGDMLLGYHIIGHWGIIVYAPFLQPCLFCSVEQ